ncbi:hypothetical protein JB92DRAFT_3094144 [Gautieria morchelliformis]|nr:hypothetical protein JB92DRAFT_3094144 [Gautieria morchelliformis]
MCRVSIRHVAGTACSRFITAYSTSQPSALSTIHNGIHYRKPVHPPRATIIRYPNAVFEARIRLPGAAAHIDVVPHGNFVLVTGSLAPRVRTDAEGKPSNLVFTDQPCGVFGRDIPVNLTAGTELIVLSAHQDCDDYVFRYTIRNSITPRANCADIANAAASVSGASGCKCPPGMKGSCGGATTTGAAFTPGFVRPGSCAVPPALLSRGPGYFGYDGYAGYAGYNHGFAHTSSYATGAGPGFAHGSRAGFAHGFGHPGYNSHGLVFHPNGGATF